MMTTATRRKFTIYGNDIFNLPCLRCYKFRYLDLGISITFLTYKDMFIYSTKVSGNGDNREIITKVGYVAAS